MPNTKLYGDGTITERKDGRFQISMPGLDGQRIYRYAKNEKEAIKLHRQLLSQREQGTLLANPSRRQLLSQHMEEWLEMKRHDVKPNTYLGMKSYIKCHIDPVLGNIKLQDLTTSRIQKFYGSRLQKGMSPNSLRAIHSCLKRALDTAVKWKKIPENPCHDVELPRRLKSKNHYYTLDEVERLLNAAQGHFLFEGLIMLTLATGMRCGELLALTWDDIHFQKGIVKVTKTISRDKREDGTLYLRTVPPKSESSIRDIRVSKSVLAALQKHRMLQREERMKAKTWEDSNLVFCTHAGEFIWPANLYLCFKRLLKRAGLPDYFTFHDLRHTVGTHLIRQRIPANAVQKQMGHSDVKITLGIYAHATPEMECEVAETLESMFGLGEPEMLASSHI